MAFIRRFLLLALALLPQLAHAEESFQDLLKATREGNAKAQVKVGDAYSFGKGVHRDDVEAAKWYAKAAKQGDAKGQLELGVMYMDGQGVPRDSNQAKFWYQKSAEQGYAPAENAMGLNSSNDVEAAKWFLKAAEHGQPVAQYMMWMKLSQGQGVPRDEAMGIHWLNKSAAQGFALAQHNLGYLYLTGKQGVTQDFSQAMAWFRKAADQGYADAQDSVAVMYIDAKGVQQDFVEAYKWLVVAKDGTRPTTELYKTISQNMTFVESRMTSEQIARAKREAQDWTARHPERCCHS